MGKRVRLKRGDIFRFELDEARYGLGQIVEPGIVIYITILSEPAGQDFDLAKVDTRDILLCGRTTDAQFFHNKWHLIGNLPVPEDAIPWPCAKVAVEGESWITNFHGELLRPATDYEREHLDYQSSHSPISYEHAFRARHRLAPEQPWFAQLGVEHMRAQAAICPG